MSTTATTAAREQFDRQAANYNERWASWSDATLRRVLELADPKPEWRALDIATGTGFTALALAPYVREVVGADVSPGMLAEAKKRADAQSVTNAVWVEADAHDLPFPGKAFDLVMCRIAPHHFADPLAFVREVARVLVPGGVFVLADTTVPDDDKEAADWQNQVEKLRDPSHVRNLSPELWRTLLHHIHPMLSVLDLEHTNIGGVPLELSAWLETAGCVGDDAARVRDMFDSAPESARKAFQIETHEATGETRFAWQRVVLRAQRIASTNAEIRAQQKHEKRSERRNQ